MTEIEKPPQVKNMPTRIAKLEVQMGQLLGRADISKVPVYEFEEGMLPTRQTEGAIGYDARARAIVDPLSNPNPDSPLRKTLADFNLTRGWRYRIDSHLLDYVVRDPNQRKDYYALNLPPKGRIMVGLGFATAMDLPMYYWVAPRSGYARRGITVANSPGTVDPDYRGEAGVLLENNSDEDFLISKGMRIAQVIFSLALIPELKVVNEHQELGDTSRSTGGFGSTGSH